MPFDPMIQYRGDQYIAQGISQAGAGLQQALAKYEEDKKQRLFNTGLLDSLKDMRNPTTGQSYIPADALEKWDSMDSDKMAGIIAGATRRITSDQAQQKLDIDKMLATAHASYYDRAKTGEFQTFNPSQDEINAAAAAGRVPVHTNRNSIQYLEQPEPPKLDKDGNPMYTPDGTMYVGEHGKLHPVTAPMMEAKLMFDTIKKEQAAKAAAAQKQPGFNLFDPSTWLGRRQPPAAASSGGASAQPTATPAPSIFPQIGEIRRGFRYKGGNPAAPNSWEKAM